MKAWWVGTAALLFASVGGGAELAGQVPDERSPGPRTTYERQESEGRVTLEVQPVWEDGQLSFEISATTHSVDLGRLNLGELLELSVGERRVQPLQAGRLSGHHARTTVSFAVAEPPDDFTLEIRDVPDVPVRALRWSTTRASRESTARIAVGGIDPGGLAVLAVPDLDLLLSLDGLEAVHGAAIRTDGTVAYALNMADSSRAVTAVEIPSGKKLWVTALPAAAHHAAAGAGDGRLYVTYGRMGLDPARPRGVAALNPDGTVEATLETEGTAYYLEPGAGGSRLYVTVQGPDRLLEVALPELELRRAADLPGTPSHLAVSADGKALYVALAAGSVVKVDAESLSVVATVATGADTHAIALAGTPPRVFVAVRGQGQILALDPRTLEILQTSTVAERPEHLTRLPDGALLVSDGATRDLLTLEPGSLTVQARRRLPFRPHQSSVAVRAGG